MNSVTVITHEHALGQRIHDAVADQFEVFFLPEGMLTAHLDRTRHTPHAVVLGPDVDRQRACDIARACDRDRPEVSVLLVGEPDADTLATALRVGIRDVVSPLADVDQLREAVQRAIELANARVAAWSAEPVVQTRPNGRVITVASPKGGSGKTTVTTNLAVEFGRRVPGETVVVDLDLQFGDVASCLRLEPDHSVVDAIEGAGDDMVLKTFLTAHESGCYALCGPESPADGERIDGTQVVELLNRLARGFRYIIVDTAPGLLEQTLAGIEAADIVVLLAGMDVPSVRGLRRELDLLHELDLLSAHRIVTNFVDRRSGLTIDDVEGILGEPVDVQLPRSRAVPLSTNRGVPLLAEDSRDAVAKQLRELADQLDARGARGRKTAKRTKRSEPPSTEVA